MVTVNNVNVILITTTNNNNINRKEKKKKILKMFCLLGTAVIVRLTRGVPWNFVDAVIGAPAR